MNESFDISVHSGCHIHTVYSMILILRFFLTKNSSKEIRADRICSPKMIKARTSMHA